MRSIECRFDVSFDVVDGQGRGIACYGDGGWEMLERSEVSTRNSSFVLLSAISFLTKRTGLLKAHSGTQFD